MEYLHESSGWVERARFGPGRHPRDKFTLVARDVDASALLGFFWVDDAMASDNDISDPWWCINALAVRPEIQRRGLGRQLAQIIIEQARLVGVTALYGLCYPTAVEFWDACGFTVGEHEQAMKSTEPVTKFDGTRGQLNMDCEPGHHFFFMNLDETASPLFALA